MAMVKPLQQGVALLEVLIALAIFALGVGSYMQWYSTIAQNTQRTLRVVESLNLRQELIAQLSVGLIPAGQSAVSALGAEYQLDVSLTDIAPPADHPATALGGSLTDKISRWQVVVHNADGQTLDRFVWVALQSGSNKREAVLQ